MSIKSKVESLLFVVNKPLLAKELADVLEVEPKEVEAAISELNALYQKEESGLQIVKNNNKYQMTSSGENAKEVQKLLQSETSGELSRPSLETLTIIAYRGPIKKTDLEKIRGINCSLIIRNLLLRGLIEEKSGGDKEDPVFIVSLDFIRYLGVSAVEDLPDYEKLHSLALVDKIKESNDIVDKSENYEEDEGSEEGGTEEGGEDKESDENEDDEDEEDEEDEGGNNEEDEENEGDGGEEEGSEDGGEEEYSDEEDDDNRDDK